MCIFNAIMLRVSESLYIAKYANPWKERKYIERKNKKI